MELKDTNFSGKFVVANKLNHVDFYFLKFFENKFKNKSNPLFSQGDAMIACK